MSSLFDRRSEFAAQHFYNQIGYHNQRQLQGTQMPHLTRWVAQSKSTLNQRRLGRSLGSNITSGLKNISNFAWGVGQGIGTTFGQQQAGVSSTVIPLGTDFFILGSNYSAPKSTYVYTYNRAVSTPGLALPPSQMCSVRASGGFVSVGAICTQEKLDDIKGYSSNYLLPANSTSRNPYTGALDTVESGRVSTVAKSTNKLSVSPIGSISDETRTSNWAAASASFYQSTREVDDEIIDPVSKQPTKTEVTAARAKTFKLEVLRSLLQQAETLAGVEAGRAASYPILYELAAQSWADPILLEVFKQIALIEANPTAKKIFAFINKVNQYLPVAKQVSAFLFPDRGAPQLETAGTTVDLGTLTISPSYRTDIDRVNSFLPTSLKLELAENGRSLKLGAFVAAFQTPFPFTLEFNAYVEAVNAQLPTDLKFSWGLGDPARVLFIVNGIAINTSLGLLIADTAISAADLVKQQLSCTSSSLNVVANVTDSRLDVTTVPIADNNPLIEALQASLISGLAGTIDWTTQPPSFNPLGTRDLTQKMFNSVLPPGLQLGLDINKAGEIGNISLGPLNAKRKSSTSWEFSVPNANNLSSGLEVLNTLGAIPPDLSFIQQGVVQLSSIYAENPQQFVDILGKENANIVGSFLTSPLAKFKVDYSKGVKIEQVPSPPEPVGYGPNYPQAPESWSALTDVNTSLVTSGYPDSEALNNFTERPSLAGSFLPLLSFAESNINNLRSQGNADSAARLGRSPVGLSLRDGLIPTPTGSNYSLLAALCADDGSLQPSAPEVQALPLAINSSLDNLPITGFETTQDNIATPLELEVIDTIDPQDARSVLESQLIELGLGEAASRTLTALDKFLYPPATAFETVRLDTEEEDIVINLTTEYTLPDDRDLIERNLDPIAFDLRPSVLDLFDTVASIGNLPTEQIIGGLNASLGGDPAVLIAAAVDTRISRRLDCQSLDYYASALTQAYSKQDFQAFAAGYGLTTRPALEYALEPTSILELIDRTEPRLSPAIERLLIGDLFGFFAQTIWAKTGADIYRSPQSYLRLKTNVRSYYGGAVPSSNPAREWIKEID